MPTKIRYCRRCQDHTDHVAVGVPWLPSRPIEVLVDMIASRPRCMVCRARHAKDVLRALHSDPRRS